MKNNYRTKIPASKTVGEIVEALTYFGVTSLTIDFDRKGCVYGISFEIDGFTYCIQPEVAKVRKILRGRGRRCDSAHVFNVAWRNVKDWFDSQMKYIGRGHASLEEVMLPYLVDGRGVTLFEAAQVYLMRR